METSPACTLEFFYFDAGGGHRSAALALKTVIAERYPTWQIELVNLQDLLDPIDPVIRLTHIQSQDIYNGYIKSGFTYGSAALLRTLQAGIKLLSPVIENRLEKHWRRSNPDLVVSLIPNFNGTLFRSLRRVHPQTPYVTIMTDLADSPPHFWLEKQDQFVICGSELAFRQAHAIGYSPEKIFKTSGMILKPHFYHERTADRRSARNKLGLDPDLPTALIMFGGYGSIAAVKILERLEALNLGIQSIVMCGHNKELYRTLKDRPNCLAIGFTDQVPEYMNLADFFIGKPGPGSISEALHMGLPVILERNRRTMLQETYNTRWVIEKNIGVVVKSFSRIANAVRFLLEEGRLEKFRENARSLNNQAVFEIPEILQQILKSNPAAISAPVIPTVPVQTAYGSAA